MPGRYGRGIAELGGPVLEIAFLGGQRVSDGGHVVDGLRSGRALALLAYLVLHPGLPQERRRIAGLFWPDSSEAQARTNLRRELHELRLHLPAVDRCIAAAATSLQWRSDAPASVDVVEVDRRCARAEAAEKRSERFRELAAAAVSRYPGDLLPGLDDDWVVERRDRLRRRVVNLLDELVETERGRAPGAAIEHALRRTELEPLEERGYRQLVELYAAVGDRAAAIRVYHRCVTLLEQELGVAPDPATTEAYHRLTDTATRAIPRPRGTPPAGGPPPARDRLPLVGRDAQLAELLDLWQRAQPRRPGFVVVAGEPGIGKSRLAGELALAVRQTSAVTVRARCFPGVRLALAPVSEWLRSPPLVEARGRLDPVWRAEVERLVPSGAAGEAGARDRPRPLADSWQRHRFFEGLARAVLAVDRPLLLVLDDLQWCDADTLAFLQLLLRLPAEHRLLVVATGRLDELEASAELGGVLRDLRSARVLRMLTLEPLTEPDVATIAAALLPGPVSDDDVRALHAVTGGNPLLVLETLRERRATADGKDAGALPAQSVLAARLAQVGPVAGSICELAAAAGRDFSLELLTEASDMEPDAVVAAVDELWRRRLLREHSPGTYDFSHDLLRDAAYQQVSPPRRRLLHRRLAHAIELLSGDGDDVAAGLADHYGRAGNAARAIHWHVRAAEAAAGVFANDSAVQHYAKAREFVSQLPATRDRDAVELEVCYGMSAPLNALHGYASRELEAVLDRACLLAERLGQTRTLLLALVGLWAVRFVQGRTATSCDLAARAVALSEAHRDLACQAHLTMAGSVTSLGRPAEALSHFQLARDLSVGAEPVVFGTRAEVHAEAWSAHARWLAGDTSGALAAADAAIERGREIDHPYSLVVALAYGAITHQLCGDVAGTARLADTVLAMCDRYGFAYYREWGVVLSAWAHRGPDAVERVQSGLTALRRSGAFARHPYYMSLLADVLHGEGRDDAARAVLTAARAVAHEHDDHWWLPDLWRQEAGYTPNADSAAAMLARAAETAHEQGSAALRDRALAELAVMPGAADR